jgi:predicted RNA binding protein YcfA (HicA-like mRNA interferase family)
MVKLPVISGKKLVKALSKIGYVYDRTSGSHMILLHPEKRRLSVPDHKEIGKGLLHELLQDAGITADKLRELL